jgi:hypothetical protein
MDGVRRASTSGRLIGEMRRSKIILDVPLGPLANGHNRPIRPPTRSPSRTESAPAPDPPVPTLRRAIRKLFAPRRAFALRGAGLGTAGSAGGTGTAPTGQAFAPQGAVLGTATTAEGGGYREGPKRAFAPGDAELSADAKPSSRHRSIERSLDRYPRRDGTDPADTTVPRSSLGRWAGLLIAASGERRGSDRR